MFRVLKWLVCVLPLAFSGCATHYIWSESPLDEFREPSVPNEMRLYDAAARKDVLVEYHESLSSSDSSKPRAYFALQNQKRILDSHKPHFVDLSSTNRLASIPLLSSPTNFVPMSGLIARRTAKEDQFELFRDGQSLGIFDLPTYPSSSGKVKKILLTPITVALDATVIGGVIYTYSLGGMGYLEP